MKRPIMQILHSDRHLRCGVEFIYNTTPSRRDLSLCRVLKNRSQIVTSKGRGGRRYMPYAFTEQGIAMLSAVLHSEIAIKVSIHTIPHLKLP